jgi:hypothetical protein
MKVALCLSGQSRMFKSSYESLKSNILDHYDCDIFIDTWKFANMKQGFRLSYKYPEEGTLEELFELYQPKVLNIERFDEAFETICLNFESLISSRQGGRDDNFVRRYYAMLYKIYNCNKIKNEYSAKFRINYDIVIRSRLDTLYTSKINLIPNTDLIADIYGNGISQAGDIFAYGNTNDMNIYSNLFLELMNYFNQNIEINTIVTLPYHLHKNIPNHKLINHNLDIIRPADYSNIRKT